MSDWVTAALEDLSTRITKGTTPSKSMGGFSDFGVNYVKSESITHSGIIDASKFQYISIENHERLKRSQLVQDDILFSMAGVHLGKTAMVKEEHLPANTNQAVCLIRIDPFRAYPKFVFYSLRRAEVKHFALNATSQSAQPNINLKDIGSISVPLPAIEDQKAIAHILGALDDKIELNQKMNQTLEDIAKAIFKSWFVDFDPVRAKAEGRPTGLPPEISDLFPDELVDSEIGEIPKGWGSCEVRSFVKLNDQSWSKKNHPDSLEYLDLGNIKSNKISEIETYLWDEAPSRARRVLKTGDTIVGTVRPGNRSFGFVQRSGITGSTGFAVLTPLKDEYAEFIYLGVCSDTNIERLAHLADGAAYPAVSNEIILDTSFVEPPPDLVMGFHKLVSPLMQRLEIAEQENKVLSDLRNTILPKLISGELRIPDAEKFLEEAGI